MIIRPFFVNIEVQKPSIRVPNSNYSFFQEFIDQYQSNGFESICREDDFMVEMEELEADSDIESKIQQHQQNIK